jgi:pimeloyl-ACP methyl ester carboxylesterase
MTPLAGSRGVGDLLVVGPSLGTSVEALWGRSAGLLAPGFEVVGWDLPGHGRGKPANEAYTVADLAQSVRQQAAALGDHRPTWYAGVSIGGAVALHLALDPGRFGAVVALASAPKIGETQAWHERAELVRRSGSAVMVSASAQRWFAPGFTDREPDAAGSLLRALADSDSESYARACEALAAFDLRSRMSETTVPWLIGAGEHDPIVTPIYARSLAPKENVVVVPGVAHQPPTEDPSGVAKLLAGFFTQLGATR